MDDWEMAEEEAGQQWEAFGTFAEGFADTFEHAGDAFAGNIMNSTIGNATFNAT